MTRVAITDQFLKAFANIPKAQQTKVRTFMEKFRANPHHSSLNYEQIYDVIDDKVRTVRIDKTWRAVVIHPPKGDVFLCVHVGHHDKAMDWARRKRFDVNPLLGSLQIYEVSEAQLEKPLQKALSEPPPPPKEMVPKGRLLEKFSNEDLYISGVPQLLLPAVRALITEEDLDGLASYLPREAADALYMLAAGFSVDEAIEEAMRKLPEKVDVEDFAAALDHPATQQHVKELQGDQELREILAAPLELWRVFLHPTQRKLVSMHAKGPVRVLGGAGTGKTVVAMHRVKHLVANVFKEADDKILFTTYTANLASDIRRSMATLCGPESERVFVLNLDAFAKRFLMQRGRNFKMVDDKKRLALMNEAVATQSEDLDLPESFFQEEWDQIVLAHGVVDRPGYLKVPRVGRGRGLNRRQRLAVWKVFEGYRARLDIERLSEWPDVIREAWAYLDQHPGTLPYRAVVADEVQDLPPIALKLLRAIVPEAENDIFVVGDAHQRIYANQASLGACGIDIRGRGKRLRINYRTTEKIRDWAAALLQGVSVDDLDEGVDSLKGYRSLRGGASPEVVHWQSADEEAAYLVEKIESWLEKAPAEEICICGRTKRIVEQYKSLLEKAGIDTVLIDPKNEKQGYGVRLATMHRVKGLEFPRMMIVGVKAGCMPYESKNMVFDSEGSREDHLQRERCLLFVAATRARDELVVTGSGEKSVFMAGA